MYRTILVPVANITASKSVPCRLRRFPPVPYTTLLNYSSSSAQDTIPAKITQLESEAPYAARVSRWIRPARSLFAILSTFTLSTAIGMILATKISSYIEYICVNPLYSPSCWYFWQDSIREQLDE